MKPLKIGEAAKQTGISVKAIRFYEKIGLIPAPDRLFSTGYRLYTERDVRRLRVIKRSKLLGLTLSQIKEIVASLKGEGYDCNRLRPRLQKLVDERLGSRHGLNTRQDAGWPDRQAQVIPDRSRFG